MTPLIRAAIWCGALPLVAGLGVLVAWAYTSQSWLPVAGLAVLGVGVLLFICGAGALLAQRHHDLLAGEVPRSNRATKAAWGLLLANFPIAALCVFGGLYLHARYTVEVVNETGVPIERVEITSPGIAESVGPIAPAAKTRCRFIIPGDGTLTFTAHAGGKEITGTVDGYVTNGMGGDRRVILQPDGKFTVHNLRRNL
jgi:hypothetical protein